jgi:uncharacterized protein YlxW (UPF0749 family)
MSGAAATGPARLGARIRSIPSWQITLGGALLVLGFLIAAQIASEGPRVRYTSQERTPLVETALDLQAQQEALKTRILQLRSTIGDLEASGQGSAALAKQLADELQQARIAAGLVPLRGPGIVLQLEDSTAPVPDGADDSDYLVGGRDILTVVDELWLAGAEAVAVNGERVSGPTAIVDIGGSVLVNSAYLAPPYQVAAIGPKDLFDRLRASRSFSDFLQARSVTFGLRISFAEPGDVDIPAYAGTVGLRNARTVPSASPSGAP